MGAASRYLVPGPGVIRAGKYWLNLRELHKGGSLEYGSWIGQFACLLWGKNVSRIS